MRKIIAVFIFFFLIMGGFAAVSAATKHDSPRNNFEGSLSETISPDKLSTDNLTDIYDIKAPQPFPGTPFAIKLAMGAGATVVLFLIFFLLLRYFRKRRREEQRPSTISPEKAALKALDKIRDIMEYDGKIFYFRLSLALREYIEGKFSVNAVEMTTEELMPALKFFPIDKELESETRSFFVYSDRVKFAGKVAERVNMDRHFKFVRFFVKKTSEADLENYAEDSGASERILSPEVSWEKRKNVPV